MDFITFKHSFNAGDLITVLPGIKHICEKNNTKAVVYQRLDLPADYGHNDPHPVASGGRQVCMNTQIFSMIKPLIEAQGYIDRFEVWEGQQVDFDYDKTRQNSQMPLPGGSIHKWPSLIFPQLECDLSAPWIDKTPELPKGSLADWFGVANDYVLINRTDRYQNPYIDYHFLNEYSTRLLFIGTEEEWKAFNSKFNLRTALARCKDFRQLANVVSNCLFFIGNQSFCWHVADAIKVPRILEVCAQYPNTFPTGKDGYSFITQEALEFRFHKLLNESNA
jgi:hypothetical protein